MAENIIAPPDDSPKKPKSMRLVRDLATSYIAGLDDRMNGVKNYVASGFRAIDKFVPGWLHQGHLVILAGRPSMGKSGLALQLAENVAKDGKTVIFYTLEMSGHEMTERAISRRTGITVSELKTSAELNSDQWSSISKALEEILPLPLLIDDGTFDLVQIVQKSHAVAAGLEKQGLPPLGCIVVDYLQLVGSKAANRNLEIGQVSKALKRMAMELNVPVIALSQLNRGVENRAEKRPVMADLRESGNIEQDADSVAFLYRDDFYNPLSPDRGIAEFIVDKNRHGTRGTARLAFVGERIMFGDLAHG